MSRRYFGAGLALFFALMMTGETSLAITVVSHTADFEPRIRTGGTIPPGGPHDPGESPGATRLRVGFQTNFRIDAAYFFKLPALGPSDQIIGADFSVAEVPDTAPTAIMPNHNADLVALGFTNFDPPGNGAGEGEAYYYVGEGSTDNAPGRQLIQDNFLVPSDFIPSTGTSAVIKSTNPDADSALQLYIADLYLNQDSNGFLPGTSYLILRLNPDLMSDAGTRRYSLSSAESLAGTHLPTLTLEVESPFAPGDINRDGVVDREDMSLFATFYGRMTGSDWTTGDFDGDMATTLHDLALLQSNFGPAGGSPTAVPEPTGWLLALLGLLVGARSKSRRII